MAETFFLKMVSNISFLPAKKMSLVMLALVRHIHALHVHPVHALAAHAHAILTNVVQCMLYVRINSDMPTVALGPKPVQLGHIHSIVLSSVLQRKLACC